ncbi:MAG TPA: glycosyl hydrolase family 28-related protein [Caulobacteraceae bacterium]|nr:glycosyl hydrolase family 28-related protein [Caulobacteraceae bacterium]
MDYDSVSAAARSAIGPDVQLVRTAGFARPGDGGDGSYQRTDSPPPHAGAWFRSADGACWRYAPDARGVNARAFGARGDAVADPKTFRLVSGTDDSPAIQNAIDFAIYGARRPVYLPAGVYRIDEVLHLGYGAGSFESVTLEGDGPNYRGQMGGSLLLASFSDRPALAVQGARMSRIRDLGLMGCNAGWILDRGLMGRTPAADDTILANWLAADLHPNADSRYAPYAAIAIDPYSGAKPSQAYPEVRYPAFLGPVSQYDKAFSSDVLIENCYIGGFVVALAIHPSDASGNGDFIRMRNSLIELCAYVVSAGDGQGREVSLAQCSAQLFHTGVVNSVHGRRQGQLDFTSDATSWESCIQIFDIGGAAFAAPFKFTGCYSENIWRIGNWGHPGAEADSPLAIEDHLFHFSAQQDCPWRGIPSTILDAAAPNPVALRNCDFANFSNVMLFGGDVAYYTVENCTIQVHSTSGAVPDARPLACDKLVHDALAGGICFTPSSLGPARPQAFSMGTGVFNIDTGDYEGPSEIGRTASGRRAYPICAWSQLAQPRETPGQAELCPVRWTAYDKSRADVIVEAAVAPSSGRLTARFASLSAAQQALAGPAPGDLIYDSDSRSIFRVRSVSGAGLATVVADLWNNHRIRDGAASLFDAFKPRAGVFFVLNTRLYMPAQSTQGQFTAGSRKVARVGRADGYGGYVGGAGEIQTGDWLYQNPFTDATLGQGSRGDEVVSASAGSPGALLLAHPAAATVADKPISFLFRRPPPNAA